MTVRTGGAHLALVLPSLVAGGVGRSVLTLAGEFARLGHRVDLVLCERRGEYLSDVPADVNVVTLRRGSGLGARARIAALDPAGLGAAARPALLAWAPAPVQPYLTGLRDYLRQARPDALFAAKTHTNVLAVWARALAGVPTRVVVSERTQLSQSIALSPRWRWRHVAPVVGRVYRRADAITAVSDGVADDLAQTAGLPRASIRTLYNPVVTPALHTLAAQAPAHPWLTDGGAPVVVGAGRLVPQKNFGLLIKAFARLRANRPARLLILGEGRERDALLARAAALGVAADVALPGFVQNPFAVFSRAALFVLSSDYEGLPGVLVQALACACPVVSADCPSGPVEILAGGLEQALVPVGDAAAMAAAMARTLDAPPPADRLRAQARRFTVQASAQAHLDVLLPGAAPAVRAA